MVCGLLVAFAASANRRIGVTTLSTVLWDHPPDSARANLRSHVAQLRQLLSGVPCTVETHHGSPSGYSLHIAPEQLDIFHFRDRVRQARLLSATDPDRAMAVYEIALDLWCGDYDGILPDTVAMQAITTGWNLEYNHALSAYAEVAIARKSTSRLLNHLYRQAIRHPYDPTVTSMLRRAIIADGSPSDVALPSDLAMAAYTTPKAG
nr:BTAD domain-containing putative transcriptional regulator [Stackebrandtia endophytica]